MKEEEKEDRDYVIRCSHRDSEIAIIAPHGGGIEPGTTEIAETIAEHRYSFYTFEGTKPQGNKRLHIASERFDEDMVLRILQASKTVVAIHGCRGHESKVFIGGLDKPRGVRIAQRLEKAGFQAEVNPPKHLAGEQVNNICNKGTSRRGIQIEIDDSVRRKMFWSLSRNGREGRTRIFYRFANAIRSALQEIGSPKRKERD